MQQPPGSQEQLAVQQQMGHQMVLCPVRLVYETQILVQPGDQIQPNQTIVINPQNPPPWIQQNRPVQNQVMYIQQFQPNNIVPSAQQHIDQNQYIVQQNLANIQQQVLQQQMLMQNQQEQMRQVQMQYTNVIPTEMMQNLRPALPQNVQQVQNERITEQSLVKYQPSNDSVQNQVNNMQNAVNRQLVANIQNQNVVSVQRNQAQAMQQANVIQGMYPNIQNIQMNQQINSPRQAIQQYITMNPMATMHNNQNINQQASIRPSQQNVQIRQVHSQPVVQNLQNQPTYTNASPNQNIMITRAVKPSSPMTITRPNVSMHNTGTMTVRQNFRPIQPRPQQYKTNVATISQNNMQLQRMPGLPPIPNQVHVPTSVTYAIPKQETLNSVNMVPQPTVKTAETNTMFNRKRKSESPDEIQNKMQNTSTQISEMTVTKLQNNLMAKNVARSEIGVNTSPVHKAVDHSNSNQPQPAHILPINSPFVVSQSNPVVNQSSPSKPVTIVKMETPVPHQAPKPVEIGRSMPDIMAISPQINNKDKLVRNTVYTQARGRIVSEKVEPSQPITLNKVENNAHTAPDIKPANIQPELKPILESKPVAHTSTEAKPSVANVKMEIQNEIKLDKPIKTEVIESKNDTPPKTETKPIKREVKETKPIIPPLETKPMIPPLEAKPMDPQSEAKPPVNPPLETRPCLTSVDNLREKQIQMSDTTKTKEERDFILTHVLDGYVIQESNVAFPIRKPLQERLIPNETVDKTEQKEKAIEDKEAKSDDKVVDNMLTLNLAERKLENQSEEMNVCEEDPNLLSPSLLSPFEKLDTKTVKSWTVNQLSTHLLKYGWSDTINILREHEIDGESLFLVSKPQLVTIGISENHAEVICGFVKS